MKEVPSVLENTTVEDMLPLLPEIRQALPVVNEANQLAGLVSTSSIIIEMTGKDKEEIDQIVQKRDRIMINIGKYIEIAINWLTEHFARFFDVINDGVGGFIDAFQDWADLDSVLCDDFGLGHCWLGSRQEKESACSRHWVYC